MLLVKKNHGQTYFNKFKKKNVLLPHNKTLFSAEAKDGLINIAVSRNTIKDVIERVDALWILAKLQQRDWNWNSFMSFCSYED